MDEDLKEEAAWDAPENSLQAQEWRCVCMPSSLPLSVRLPPFRLSVDSMALRYGAH